MLRRMSISHKLVCVLPPTWTNSVRRNEILVLGTFVVGPQTQSIERILEQVEGEHIVAKQLGVVSNAYGFDG